VTYADEQALQDARLVYTMLRVTELERSINFYTGVLGMRLLRRQDYPEGRFTLAFVGYDEERASSVIELTHNWDGNTYAHGTAFGHIAIGVRDAYAACRRLEAAGARVTRPAGPMKADPNEVIAFVEDPDGYRIELVQEMQPQLQADSGTVHMSNYLFFTTQCEQALAFYAQCGLGRVVEVMRYGADGVPVANEALRGKVMHAKFEGPGVLFYASDNDDAEPMRGSAHILMMTDRVLTLELFNRLVEGGTITTPIGVQAWGDYYGKATDQFGVQWMLNCRA